MRNLYTVENLQRAIRSPILIIREAIRLMSLPFHHLYGKYLDFRLGDGMDVMLEDWDNLVILDACRYDYFEVQNSIAGSLFSRISRGSKSWEFMQENFAGEHFPDTVYVSANPYISRLDDDVFFAVDALTDEWDEEIGTVLPGDVVSAAHEANNEHPDKRLIVHFMQPHRPYLGETADQLRDRVDLIGYKNEGDGLQVWGAAKERKVSTSEVRTAYSESLDIVLSHANTLIEELDGKSVVTSDHGEMLGEKLLPFSSRIWGHSEGFSTLHLRRVPWLTVPAEHRRSIQAEESTEPAQLEESELADRLQALGYRE